MPEGLVPVTAEKAEMLVDEQGDSGFAEALAGLPDGTREWFEEECEHSKKYSPQR